MAFDVRCPKCQKRYAADERLVGKRIRCRQCGTVFPVLAVDETDAPARKPQAAGVAAVADPFAEEAAPAANRAGGTSAGTSLAHDNLLDDEPPPAPAKADPREPVFTDTETAPEWLVRGSRPQPFPASRTLERWVPRLLPAAMVAWAVQESFADDHSGTHWAPIVRLLLVAAIYLGVAVPLTLKAAYVALRMHRYAPPPKPYWRTAVIFCLPAALGFVLWMVSSSAVSFVGGCAVGVALAFLVYWLLFRQDWGHAGASYAIAGGTFMAAALLGMALMMGLNFALNQIFIASHDANRFVRSPLGDDLAWTAPPAQRKPPAVVVQANNQGSTPDQSTKQPQTSPPVSPDVSHAQTPTNASDESGGSSQPPPVTGTNAGEQSAPTAPPSAHDGGRLFATNDGGSAAPDPVVSRIKAAKIPWVAAVSACDQTSNDHFLFQLVPSKFVGVIRRQATGAAEIECCALDPFARVGTVPLIDPPTDDPSGLCGYAISTDGTRLLRLADFPSQQIEVQSFARPGEIDKIPLTIATTFKERSAIPDRTFSPQLLGALPDGQALIRWTRARGDIEILEVWDCQKKIVKLRRLARASAGIHTIGNFAVSPDGKWFASTAPDVASTSPAMWVYSLAGPKAPSSFPISEIDAQRWPIEPAGIAFSPDSKKVAVLFEHDAEGYLVAWDVASGKRIKDAVCSLPTARALAMLGGPRRSLDWISNDVLLLHGVTLLQASTGAVIGSLGDEVITGQQLAGNQTVYLSYREGGCTHLAALRFDPARLPVEAASNP